MFNQTFYKGACGWFSQSHYSIKLSLPKLVPSIFFIIGIRDHTGKSFYFKYCVLSVCSQLRMYGCPPYIPQGLVWDHPHLSLLHIHILIPPPPLPGSGWLKSYPLWCFLCSYLPGSGWLRSYPLWCFLCSPLPGSGWLKSDPLWCFLCPPPLLSGCGWLKSDPLWCFLCPPTWFWMLSCFLCGCIRRYN